MTNIINRFKKERVIPIIRTDTKDEAINCAKAAINAGFSIIEFTMTIENALKCISELKKIPNVLLGMGTVVSKDQAQEAIKIGADFIVSPHIDTNVIDFCNAKDVMIIPGAATPTEIFTATKLGCKLIKVFPVNCLGGVDFIKALLAPYPYLNIFATGGVNEENFTSYLNSGCVCIGLGSSIFNNEYIKSGQYDEIEKKAYEILDKLRNLKL